VGGGETFLFITTVSEKKKQNNMKVKKETYHPGRGRGNKFLLNTGSGGASQQTKEVIQAAHLLPVWGKKRFKYKK